MTDPKRVDEEFLAILKKVMRENEPLLRAMALGEHPKESLWNYINDLEAALEKERAEKERLRLALKVLEDHANG